MFSPLRFSHTPLDGLRQFCATAHADRLAPSKLRDRSLALNQGPRGPVTVSSAGAASGLTPSHPLEHFFDEGVGLGRKRRKSYETLALHNSLLAAVPKGLVHFGIPDSSPIFGDPFSWPSLSIATDQGPEMLCSCNYLQFERIAGSLWQCCCHQVLCVHPYATCTCLAPCLSVAAWGTPNG